MFTEHISRSSRSDPAIEPTIAPIYETKAIYFAVVSRSLDQALSPPSYTTPDAREGRVKGKLRLILQMKVSVWQTRLRLRSSAPPPAINVGISATHVKEIVAHLDLSEFDGRVAHGFTPVVQVVYSHPNTRLH